MPAARFGVIGLGVWGERHVQAYSQHPHANIAAVCDTNEQTLNAVGERYGITRRFTDYGEMLGSGEVDAVSIVTPDFAHADIAVHAVEQGKHVLVEKPLATSVEDCERIGEALRRRPVKFMVDFHSRWNPGVAHIKERIRNGDLGEPLMAYVRLSDNRSVPTEMLSWAGGSSVNWFLGSHCLDMLRWLMEDEVSRVYTVRRSRVLKGMGIETPDFYQSVLEFVRGATALLETCWIIAPASPRLFDLKLEVVGEKATAYFDGAPEALQVYTAEGAAQPDIMGCALVHGRAVGFAIESILHFADCVTGDTDPLVGFAEGFEVTKIIAAMEESARTGKPVSL